MHDTLLRVVSVRSSRRVSFEAVIAPIQSKAKLMPSLSIVIALPVSGTPVRYGMTASLGLDPVSQYHRE